MYKFDTVAAAALQRTDQIEGRIKNQSSSESGSSFVQFVFDLLIWSQSLLLLHWNHELIS